MNSQYEYAGQHFTPTIAAELILELCEGEPSKKVR